MAALVRLVCVSGELGLLSDHAKDLDELVSVREEGSSFRSGGLGEGTDRGEEEQSRGRWLTHSSRSAGVFDAR